MCITINDFLYTLYMDITLYLFCIGICTYFVTDGPAYIIMILQEWTAQALWFQTIRNSFCSLMYYEKSYI